MTEILGGLAAGPADAAYAVAAVLVAGLVRGFTGFGMSAVIVLALSMTLPPAEVVPMALLMEIAASAHMLPAAWKDVDWTYARGLLAGSAVGIPAGVALLVYVAPDPMRAVLSVFVLTMSGLILGGFRFRGRPGTRWGYGVGLVAGLANGAASFGGQPTALFLLSTPIAAAAARATLVFLAIVTSAYGAATAYFGGLLGPQELARAAVLLIPMAIGIAAGSRHFLKAAPETYRRFALGLLMALAAAGLIRAALG
ncbi:MAG: sulfite exporter TauE/SafE family protein [Rhodospirillales bacterium]|jgi:uncharacterized membrane protein YfcA|nr:sulfite exporter TauE/SafE family protein [Rhodospirillales bacterium]